MSRADRENRIRKNIPVKSYFLGKMIGDFLEEQIDPAVNFLMSGDDENRRSILYERIVQLYLSEEVEDRPIIVVVSSCKENREMLDELEEAIESDKISRVRDFIKIDTDNPEYCLFKGMNATQIEQAIEQSGKAFGDKRDANNWNSSAFSFGLYTQKCTTALSHSLSDQYSKRRKLLNDKIEAPHVYGLLL